MWLNEEQLSVIKEARELMGDERPGKYPPRYICLAVGEVLADRKDRGDMSDEAARSMKHQLSTGILAGISHMVTFGGFMLHTCPTLENLAEADPSAYYEMILLARLTWLDWIIHTGEIKQDLLAGEER